MRAATAHLVITNPHSADTQVFWRGMEVPNVLDIRIDDKRTSIRVELGTLIANELLFRELVEAGVLIRTSKD